MDSITKAGVVLTVLWIWAGVGFAGIGSFLLLVWPLLVVVMTPYGIYRWANRDRR